MTMDEIRDICRKWCPYCGRSMPAPAKRVVYVAGPLRADTAIERQRNAARAMAAAETMWELGWVVICPHTNSGDMVTGNGNEQLLVEGSRELVRRSDDILLLPGWTGSVGSVEEANVAWRRGNRFLVDRSVGSTEVYSWMEPVVRIGALSNERLTD